MLFLFSPYYLIINYLVQNYYAISRNADFSFNSTVCEREQKLINYVKVTLTMTVSIALHKHRSAELQQLILTIYNTS